MSITSESFQGSYEATTGYYDEVDGGGFEVYVKRPCALAGYCSNYVYSDIFIFDGYGEQLYEVISGGMGRFIPGSYIIDDGESSKQIIGELTVVKGKLVEVVKGNLVEVLEPSTLSILALSIIGLASRRFKKNLK